MGRSTHRQKACLAYHDLNDDGSILAIEKLFEFIPEDQWEAEHPKTLLATEVRQDSTTVF